MAGRHPHPTRRSPKGGCPAEPYSVLVILGLAWRPISGLNRKLTILRPKASLFIINHHFQTTSGFNRKWVIGPEIEHKVPNLSPPIRYILTFSSFQLHLKEPKPRVYFFNWARRLKTSGHVLWVRNSVWFSIWWVISGYNRELSENDGWPLNRTAWRRSTRKSDVFAPRW